MPRFDHRRWLKRRDSGSILKWLLIAIGAIAVGGAGWLVLDGSGGRSEPSERDLYVTRTANFNITIPASGELQALNSIEVRSELEDDAIIEWLIDEGEQVRQGDLLLRFVDDEIRTDLEEEELEVESAKSDLIASQKEVELQTSQNKSQEDQARLALELARLELKRWEQGEHVTRLKDIDLAIERAERNVERYTREYNDSKELYEEGFESLSKVQEDEIRMIEAKAELEKAILARETYNKFEEPKARAEKTSAVEEAVAALERVLQRNESILTQRKADLLNRERQFAIRENRLANLRSDLEHCVITAPADGLVVYGSSVNTGHRHDDDRPLQIGQEVDPNQLVMALPDIRRMIAVVNVHESHSKLVEPGMKARVRVDALPELVLPAEVESVGIIAQQSGRSQMREYTITLQISEENGWGLKPSMRCRTDIILSEVEEALAVPLQSVFGETGNRYVWIAGRDGRFHRRPVETGRHSEMLIEITGGLEVGETVLLREPTSRERERA